MTQTPPPSPGPERIREALAHLPAAPGVYRMLNAAGEALYVGKAKHLRNRVTSYTATGQLSTRILRMVAQVVRVEWTVTGSEAEALLVEANLIKQHKPRYNILLKDDKSFPYLHFTPHTYPRLVKHRGGVSGKGEFFGPFANVGALNATIALLQRVFLLRPCADTVFKNRSRPCLQYQIKRCSAPCVGYVTPEEYAGQLTLARNFLHGKSREVQDALQADMQRASDAMAFEQAALLRDRIRALTQVQQEQGLRVAGLTDADVIALHFTQGGATVAVFFFRQGLHFGSQIFTPRHTEDASAAETMAAFLGQFYHSRTPPREILMSHVPADAPLLAEALSLRVPYKVGLHVPERGDKRALVTQALAQADAAHQRALLEAAAVERHLEALAALFNLARPPARIEVFDNSHLMGTHQLGAMIVATPEGFKKSAYRLFNRKSVDTISGDDLSMMREVMLRRFKGGKDSEAELPELLLIDGGQTQLAVVREVLAELGLGEIPTVSIAKGKDRNAGREWFFMEGRAPFQLPVGDPTLHYLERLRDEAHRFAIGAHRNKRSRSLAHSALDDIPGIGPKRKKALLLHFGARADVERATLAELKNVPGIDAKTAEQIFAFFRGN
jgi:excinuclease ABC subunit C